MLKALELSGFKSFADRTRFEFPRGISVVVGPNGSGKSNLVDAVKWVLGSQSAKSLRGKEMTDVIFNGCPSRPPLGTGEATLTLDNDDGRLPVDAKEVHVTRRVYRSGEGEYLLNRQPCRLRDIREVLAGTGITTEAYCIIEQGKVDSLLQSSPRERRVIFEEAAGISQFKAKKITATRRLERVEQNLLRLSDIVDEVESRLRSVRTQAGKARRYRECTERLQHLRTEVGLVDWRTLTKQISVREAQLAELHRRRQAHGALVERAESEARDLERELESGMQRLREIEAAASTTREQIAARQSTVENQGSRRVDLQQEVDRIRKHLAALGTRAGSAVDQFREAADHLRSADADLATAAAQRQEHMVRAAESQRELEDWRLVLEQVRAELAETTRSAALAADHSQKLKAELATASAAQERARRRLMTLVGEREAATAELARCEQSEAACGAEAQSHQTALRGAEQRLAQVRGELARVDKQHRGVEARLTRTRERIAVLSELEHRLEGLDGGVQEVLRLAGEAPDGPLGKVHGVVADLFHVDVDSAPLVEVALGERAQFIVVTSAGPLLERLEREPLRVAGRVGFLRLDTRPGATALDNVDLSAESGVMGRADRFVETAPDYVSLVKRLVGRTWLVDRLSTALRLSQTTGRGLEFVTSDGELLAADGTLVIGPRTAAAGIMSRRSELRACNEQAADLDKQLAHHAANHTRLDQERAQQERLVASSVAGYSELAGRLADCRQQTAASRARLERTTHQHEQIERDLRSGEQQIRELGVELAATDKRQQDAEAAAEQLKTRLSSTSEKLSLLQQRQAQLQSALTRCQVAAAKCEQRVEMLRQQMDLAQRNQQERDRALAETRERLVERQAQLAKLDETMLADRQALAELFLLKERHVQELARQASDDELLRGKRSGLTEQIRSERQQLAVIQSQQHKLEVATSRLSHERQTLCERMQDDYGIDLAAVAEAAAGQPGVFGPSGASGQPGASATGPRPPVADAPGSHSRTADAPGSHSRTADAPGSHSRIADAPGSRSISDRDAVEREIAELRDQINHIGSVNLDALSELEQLETRFSTLSGHYRDLVDGKATLERIIHRINADSRELFLTTLETIRGHFQELFRRLFGGGEADIVVDAAEDVLESGIEIVARPPGKEACSISLLSGGEKTLTCVALLLAVFRSKPSPFCVLDEVDAALDEANIGRFIGVLREFLSFTQFIVVTHSKKTMAGADTLYGVTMEESGVSKRVSVRFEDVSEDGQILPSTPRSVDASDDIESARRAA